MRESRSSKVQSAARGRSDLLREEEIEQLAQSMIQIFGSAASAKAIEMVREQTIAGDCEAARKWHRVMSLIEETRQNPRYRL